jgi:fumarate hydratase subunit alpha
VDAFSKMMNDKAAELGMSKTLFKNPNGLPSKGQETTARDMLTLSRGYIENHPGALSYHKILYITYNGKTTTNKNPLLRMYPHVDGLKTGWTSASKHNLVATAASGDVRLVSVILGAPTSKDITYGSAFLIESGFKTVESGGQLKVAQQLEAIEGEISVDIPPALDLSKPLSAEAGAAPDAPPASADETGEEVPYYDGIPPRLAEELEFEYDIEPGDDTEFGEFEFDDPSVWPEPDAPPGSGDAPMPREGNAVREIDVRQVIDAVEALCIEANYIAGGDIKDAVRQGLASEDSEASRDVLGQLLENAEISAEGELPLCQDTGMAVVFVEMGQDVRLTGGSVRDAINEGVRRGYRNGYLRASVVADPVDRVNTGDNTPAVVYFDVVPGDKLKITVAPKGFGSENMSGVAMLTPSQGLAGIKRFIIDTVKSAGANPCPPIIVGVGVGGTMDYAALMAKKALLRPVGSANGSWLWTGLERELLEEINALDIGPAGLGGKTTALAVHIEAFPTHIAGLPVAVNIGCHATRHVETTL